jgi:hypothetical protein
MLADHLLLVVPELSWKTRRGFIVTQLLTSHSSLLYVQIDT